MTDYTKLVEDLRDIEKTMFALGTSPINMDNVSIRLAYDKRWGPTANDAADAIEALIADVEKKESRITGLGNRIFALEQQFPKRGEWIYEDLDNFRKYKVTCPHCGAWFVGNYDAYDDPSEFLYCPHCGNICNPTNLDWENELKEREKEERAKMEVQDGK